MGENKAKRVFFIESDVRLLVGCVKEQGGVIDSKKSCKESLELKKKAWEKVTDEYNLGQTGGIRNTKELQT